MTRPTPEKPKPCPWCGKRGVVWSGSEDWQSEWNCGCRNPKCDVRPIVRSDESDKSYVIAAWNRRTP